MNREKREKDTLTKNEAKEKSQDRENERWREIGKERKNTYQFYRGR